MPYITQAKRNNLNPAIEELLAALLGGESDYPTDTKGHINYIFTKILKRVYPGAGYSEINDAMGILSSVQAEYYRVVATPLENQKSFENGDV